MTSAAEAGGPHVRPARTDPARVVLFGSGGFAVPVLDALAGLAGVAIVGVVSAPDRPAGRRREVTAVPVARRARELRLPLLQPSSLRIGAAVADLAALRPDLGVLADYGRIVPDEILRLPPAGILNIHPSPLPRHRGAGPIAAAILAGDRETGVTVIAMDAGIDTGPIVSSERVPLDGTETAPVLEERLAKIGARLIARTLGPWLAGALIAIPQDKAEATMTRPFRREDGRLDPARSAVELERQVRALVPWPGAFVETDLGRLSVGRASVSGADAGDVRGTLVAEGDGLALATRDGRLRLLEVGLAGGRRMAAADLRRGRPGLVGLRVLAGPVSPSRG